MWFVKTTRSGARDEHGNLPAEQWKANVVSPTLNVFDNSGESRATVIIFEATRVDDVRVYDSYSPCVATYWGTGGARVPYVSPIQSTVIGRQDHNGPNGKGFGLESEPMYTLDRAGAHGVATENVVRRLTPMECERLQGFPDNWTAAQSDSQRYRQMGNAVTVNVIESIGQQLGRVSNG